MELDEAREVAGLVASVDSLGRQAMRAFRGSAVAAYMPVFRSEVRRLLEGDRLKASQRRRLMDWAAMYGTDTSKKPGDDPKSVRRNVAYTLSEWDRVLKAAKSAGKEPGRFVHEAVMLAVLESEG